MLLVLAADEAKAKHIALGIALIEFVVSIPLWTGFSPATAAFQFGKVGAWIPDWGIGYRVGVDGISVLLVLLTTFLTPLAILGSYKYIQEKIGRTSGRERVKSTVVE